MQQWDYSVVGSENRGTGRRLGDATSLSGSCQLSSCLKVSLEDLNRLTLTRSASLWECRIFEIPREVRPADVISLKPSRNSTALVPWLMTWSEISSTLAVRRMSCLTFRKAVFPLPKNKTGGTTRVGCTLK